MGNFVHSTSELKPLVQFYDVTFGFQAGANIRVQDNQFLRIRAEANPHSTSDNIPHFVEYLFTVGYSVVFKTALKKEVPKT
jgi:hypothetical protein